MKPIVFNPNEFYTYEDYCRVLDYQLEKERLRNERVKKIMKNKYKRTKFAGFVLNEHLYSVRTNGEAKGHLRMAEDMARLQEESYAHSERVINDIKAGRRYPYSDIKLTVKRVVYA